MTQQRYFSIGVEVYRFCLVGIDFGNQHVFFSGKNSLPLSTMTNFGDFYFHFEILKVFPLTFAQVLLEEMNEQLTILKNGWHPSFQRNIFYNKDDYKKWFEKEISEIEKIIAQQEKLVQTPVKRSLTAMPHHFNDKHQLYNGLLVHLFK